MRTLFLFLFFAALQAGEAETVKMLHNLVILKDFNSANAEARKALNSYPGSPAVKAAAIHVFSKGGLEKECLAVFQSWKGDEADERFLMEEMAWGVIAKAEKNPSPMIRLLASIGAFYGNDSRGVEILKRRLLDNNDLVRLASVELASRMQDDPLKAQMEYVFQNETSWDVKIAAIKALGSMKVYSSKPLLLDLIKRGGGEHEEIEAAMEALVLMTEDASHEEIQNLAASERTYLRAMSAKLILHLEKREEAPLLMQLAGDERAEVRTEALMALALLKIPSLGLAERHFSERQIETKTAALYLGLMQGSEKAQTVILETLQNEGKEGRRMMAGMLKSSGQFGLDTAKRGFIASKDFYVKMNLSELLLNDKEWERTALDQLYEGIVGNKDLWTVEKGSLFSYLTDSKTMHSPLIPNMPEMANKEARLEILNILAIKGDSRAEDGIKSFLKDRGWGISGMSAALLLSEGDDTAIDIVRNLLEDPDPSIRIQAALILSMWDKEEKAGQILRSHYHELPKEKKEVVLEAIGRIGDKESISFLVQEMGTTHQTMRIIAAASLIKCLYD